ncbi:gonadotropin-releasing hormone II receptor-like [Chelonoidis abingdonii]|uniref:gonadotropin-releasing hormone II receptor-like n=1 Tax=Chelonoidis abingdonii TaxID=106734 RepID=UPI0013F1B06A|nr:gonadotropin-releasing hormone II receptor-like [Chelonoidis abingdonii]XP_032621965.1 gonadotropin-releasing hormone II receptor-like [Chelonoidis abingdonii]
MPEERDLMTPPQSANVVDENLSVSGCPEPWIEPTFTLAARVRVIITICFFLIAASSNSVVLYSIMRKRRKSHVRLLILSLTVADLLVTFTVMPLDAVWNMTVQWYAGDLPCKLLNFLKLFAMYSAALVLVVISLDRHSAILHPFAFANSSRRNRLMLCVAWGMSLLLASPQLFLFHLHTIPGVNFTQCVTHGSFQEHWEEITYNMFTFTTLYIAPLSVMIVCYIRIIWEISKQLKINKGLARSKNDHISKARMKTLKMTIVIVASFVICWTPYYLLGLWYWFQPDMIQRMPEYINHSLFLFGLLHTCTDPVIYGLYTPSFREDMKACLRGIETVIMGQERNKLLSSSEMNIKDYIINGGAASAASNGTIIHTVC